MMTAMYPVMLDVRGRSCLVVGAGPVGTRKAEGLVAEGAIVTVVSPEVTDAVLALDVELVRRRYVRNDVDHRWLVIAATGDPIVNQQVFDDANAAGVWVNCADEPQRCAFILPAVHREGPITVSVSTGGVSPSLAQWLRDRLAAAIPPQTLDVANELAARRRSVQGRGETTEGRNWRAEIDQLMEERG
jgi:precorrin-2 dehydrogenase / sirohydrochlorin ferrochelatase